MIGGEDGAGGSMAAVNAATATQPAEDGILPAGAAVRRAHAGKVSRGSREVFRVPKAAAAARASTTASARQVLPASRPPA